MTPSPQQLLDNAPMSRLQVIAVILCVLLNALDGFDVLAISFAAPGIADEWGISRGMLGVVLSMELIGMAVGSVVLGGVADRAGRRPTILGCLLIMSSGMFLASLARDVYMLSVIRLVTGLGIGGMLAATNAMTAECSNSRWRNANVAIMATGYPLGVIVGGSIASVLLASFDWRAVFQFGGAVTALMIPLVWLFLSESVSYLLQRRPAGALPRINGILARMGHPPLTSLPEALAQVRRASWSELFSPGLASTTILLTAAYFTHIMTFYFILKWIPKIVVDMGFSASLAGGVLVWANVGGAIGSILLGLLTRKFNVRALVLGALLGAAVMVCVFGRGQADLTQLALVAAAAGFFTNSAIVGMYAIFAQSFPTEVRAGGTGFVIGLGRGGAALGPIVAGLLFESGQGLSSVAFVMAMGSLVAAVMLLLLLRRGKAGVLSRV
ncbi:MULTISPECIES: MFS transporter [unclassified Microbulbifer]|uniref:MFS transporter n=1 Tax=unclassified Microbulbifer TaxID=2619833 RepID=UPI0027E3EF72|nr:MULTISPECIES: MFS transporter [unclassified Microbulbifer]